MLQKEGLIGKVPCSGADVSQPSCISPGRAGFRGSHLNRAPGPRGLLGLEGKNVQDFGGENRNHRSQGPALSGTSQQADVHPHEQRVPWDSGLHFQRFTLHVTTCLG